MIPQLCKNARPASPARYNVDSHALAIFAAAAEMDGKSAPEVIVAQRTGTAMHSAWSLSHTRILSRLRFVVLGQDARSVSRLNSAAPYNTQGLAAHQQRANAIRLPSKKGLCVSGSGSSEPPRAR